MKFQQLFQYLENAGGLRYFETMDDSTWRDVSKGDIVEIGVDLSLPKMSVFMDSIPQLSQMLSMVELATGKAPLDERGQQKVAALRDWSQLDAGAGVPVLMRFAGSPEYSLVAHLNPSHIKVDKNRLGGEATILCKIQRKLGDNQEYELFNIMQIMERFAINDEIKRRIAESMSALPNEFRETINPPAAIVIPLGIYT